MLKVNKVWLAAGAVVVTAATVKQVLWHHVSTQITTDRERSHLEAVTVLEEAHNRAKLEFRGLLFSLEILRKHEAFLNRSEIGNNVQHDTIQISNNKYSHHCRKDDCWYKLFTAIPHNALLAIPKWSSLNQFGGIKSSNDETNLFRHSGKHVSCLEELGILRELLVSELRVPESIFPVKLPNIGQKLYTGDDSIEDTMIFKALKSNSVENALICSCCISLPVLLEHFLDSALRNRRGNFYRSFRVLGVCLPNMILLTCGRDSSQAVEFVPVVITIQIILYLYGIISVLNVLNPIMWTNKLSIFLMISYSTFAILNCFHGYILPSSSSLNLFNSVAVSIVTAIFVSNCIYYCRSIYIQNIFIGKPMENDEYRCAIQTIEGFILLLAARFGVYAYYGFVTWKDMTADSLAAFVYIDTGILLLYTIFNDRLFRQELLHAQSAIEIKRNFVNYISHEMRTPLNTVFLGLKL
eukprot:gene10625-22182_t